MPEGYFFRSKGEVPGSPANRFAYLPVLDEKTGDGITLSIGPDSIRFVFRGRLSEEEELSVGGKENLASNQTRLSRRAEYIFEETLLELPIELVRGAEERSFRVGQAFSMCWPPRGESSSRSPRSPALALKPMEDFGETWGYSALAAFADEVQPEEPDQPEPHSLLLRKLLLDLLFDLEHSSVFEDSRAYVDLRRTTSDDPLLAAIRLKAEYWWQREKYLASLPASGEGRSERYRVEGAVALRRRRLARAEHAWLRACLDKDRSSVISGPWFQSGVEEEVRQAIFWKEPVAAGEARVSDSSDRPPWWHWKRLPERWRRLAQRRRAWHALLQRWDERELATPSSAQSAHQRNVKLDKPVPSSSPPRMPSPSRAARHWRPRAIAIWFLRRYDLNSASAWFLVLAHAETSSALKKLLIRNYSRFVGLLVAVGLLAMFSTIGGALATASFWKGALAHWHYLAPLAGVILGLVINTQRRRPARSRPVGPPLSPVSNLLLGELALLVSFLFLADLGAGSRQVSFPLSWSFLLSLFGVPVLLFSIGLFRFSRRARDKPTTEGRPFLLLQLLLPRMAFAIALAWVVMVTTEEIVKANLLVGWHQIIRVAPLLLLIAVVFASVEIHNHVDRVGRAVSRALTLIGVAFVVSLCVGVIATNLIMPRYLKNSGLLLEEEFEAYSRKHLLPTPLPETWIPLEDVQPKQPALRRERRLPSRALKSCDEPLAPPNCLSPAPAKGPDPFSDKTRDRYNQLTELTWGFESAPLARRTDARGIQVYYPPPQGPPNIQAALDAFAFFPGAVLYGSCFAVFLGIFSQALFEEKTLTEPL